MHQPPAQAESSASGGADQLFSFIRAPFFAPGAPRGSEQRLVFLVAANATPGQLRGALDRHRSGPGIVVLRSARDDLAEVAFEIGFHVAYPIGGSVQAGSDDYESPGGWTVDYQSHSGPATTNYPNTLLSELLVLHSSASQQIAAPDSVANLHAPMRSLPTRGTAGQGPSEPNQQEPPTRNAADLSQRQPEFPRLGIRFAHNDRRQPWLMTGPGDVSVALGHIQKEFVEALARQYEQDPNRTMRSEDLFRRLYGAEQVDGETRDHRIRNTIGPVNDRLRGAGFRIVFREANGAWRLDVDPTNSRNANGEVVLRRGHSAMIFAALKSRLEQNPGQMVHWSDLYPEIYNDRQEVAKETKKKAQNKLDRVIKSLTKILAGTGFNLHIDHGQYRLEHDQGTGGQNSRRMRVHGGDSGPSGGGDLGPTERANQQAASSLMPEPPQGPLPWSALSGRPRPRFQQNDPWREVATQAPIVSTGATSASSRLVGEQTSAVQSRRPSMEPASAAPRSAGQWFPFMLEPFLVSDPSQGSGGPLIFPVNGNATVAQLLDALNRYQPGSGIAVLPFARMDLVQAIIQRGFRVAYPTGGNVGLATAEGYQASAGWTVEYQTSAGRTTDLLPPVMLRFSDLLTLYSSANQQTAGQSSAASRNTPVQSVPTREDDGRRQSGQDRPERTIQNTASSFQSQSDVPRLGYSFAPNYGDRRQPWRLRVSEQEILIGENQKKILEILRGLYERDINGKVRWADLYREIYGDKKEEENKSGSSAKLYKAINQLNKRLVDSGKPFNEFSVNSYDGLLWLAPDRALIDQHRGGMVGNQGAPIPALPNTATGAAPAGVPGAPGTATTSTRPVGEQRQDRYVSPAVEEQFPDLGIDVHRRFGNQRWLLRGHRGEEVVLGEVQMKVFGVLARRYERRENAPIQWAVLYREVYNDTEASGSPEQIKAARKRLNNVADKLREALRSGGHPFAYLGVRINQGQWQLILDFPFLGIHIVPRQGNSPMPWALRDGLGSEVAIGQDEKEIFAVLARQYQLDPNRTVGWQDLYRLVYRDEITRTTWASTKLGIAVQTLNSDLRRAGYPFNNLTLDRDPGDNWMLASGLLRGGRSFGRAYFAGTLQNSLDVLEPSDGRWPLERIRDAVSWWVGLPDGDMTGRLLDGLFATARHLEASPDAVGDEMLSVSAIGAIVAGVHTRVRAAEGDGAVERIAAAVDELERFRNELVRLRSPTGEAAAEIEQVLRYVDAVLRLLNAARRLTQPSGSSGASSGGRFGPAGGSGASGPPGRASGTPGSGREAANRGNYRRERGQGSSHSGQGGEVSRFGLEPSVDRRDAVGGGDTTPSAADGRAEALLSRAVRSSGDARRMLPLSSRSLASEAVAADAVSLRTSDDAGADVTGAIGAVPESVNSLLDLAKQVAGRPWYRADFTALVEFLKSRFVEILAKGQEKLTGRTDFSDWLTEAVRGETVGVRRPGMWDNVVAALRQAGGGGFVLILPDGSHSPSILVHDDESQQVWRIEFTPGGVNAEPLTMSLLPSPQRVMAFDHCSEILAA
jgi:hypothetical protein